MRKAKKKTSTKRAKKQHRHCEKSKGKYEWHTVRWMSKPQIALRTRLWSTCGVAAARARANETHKKWREPRLDAQQLHPLSIPHIQHPQPPSLACPSVLSPLPLPTPPPIFSPTHALVGVEVPCCTAVCGFDLSRRRARLQTQLLKRPVNMCKVGGGGCCC